jgi:hypothetical protein
MTGGGCYYNWSDAWLLLSIIHASKRGGATLDRIIAAGDAINHDIFTPSEMESGLARLTSGGYIKEESGVFSPTRKAMRYSRFRLLPKSIYEELKDVGKFIGAAPFTSKQPNANELRYPGFSEAAFNEAYDKYNRSMMKYI